MRRRLIEGAADGCDQNRNGCVKTCTRHRQTAGWLNGIVMTAPSQLCTGEMHGFTTARRYTVDRKTAVMSLWFVHICCELYMLL